MANKVPKLAYIRFNWMWLKDKRMFITPIPFTHNHHLSVIDEDDDLCGLWLIEAVR